MKKTSMWRKVVILIGVIVIPLAYSLFYLAAFWDPYSRLDQLPVAVVNLDQGAQINGEERNLGNELVDRMKDNDELKWVFTNPDDAKAGLAGTSYYATITIPADFTQNVATADSVEKVKATIQYSSNEAHNFLASQILSKAMLTLEEQTRGAIDRELTQTLSDKLTEMPDQLEDLNDGIGELKDGASDLNDGAADLKAGANALDDGAADLKDGVQAVDSGAQDLKAGTKKLNNGAQNLKNGAAKVNGGAQDLRDGAQDLAGGLGQLKDGAATLQAGAVSLDGYLQQAEQGANQLAEGAASIPALLDSTGKLSDAAANMADKTAQYVAAVDGLIGQNESTASVLAGYVSRHPEAMTDPGFAALMSGLSGAGSQLAALQQSGDGIKQYTAGVADKTDALADGATGLTALQDGTTGLAGALASIEGGAATLSTGAATLTDKLDEAKTGAATLATGAATLAVGTSDLANGAKDLTAGTGKLATGAKDLASGTSQLADGATTLKSGTSDLKDGAGKLKNGTDELLDGTVTAQDKVSDSITDARDELTNLDGLASYAEEPVSVEDNPTNPVPNYGTAFAPYFMSLSLWVGAIILFVGVYLDPDNRFQSLGRYSRRRYARVAAFALVGLAQSVSLAFLVQHVLGLTVKNIWGFYASCILVSVVFTSVVEFFMVNLKDAGKFLSLLFLILQLTACGGTFPMETVPSFFRFLYPYMPMTYSVSLFKDIVSVGYGEWHSVLVLGCIFVAFTAMTVAADALRRKSQPQLPSLEA